MATVNIIPSAEYFENIAGKKVGIYIGHYYSSHGEPKLWLSEARQDTPLKSSLVIHYHGNDYEGFIQALEEEADGLTVIVDGMLMVRTE